jgi:hypothetical protein
MKFQDGFKKKLVQTDFQWNSDNALMTLRKKGGVTVTVITVSLSLWDRVEEFAAFAGAAADSSPAACRPRLRLSFRTCLLLSRPTSRG